MAYLIYMYHITRNACNTTDLTTPISMAVDQIPIPYNEAIYILIQNGASNKHKKKHLIFHKLLIFKEKK